MGKIPSKDSQAGNSEESMGGVEGLASHRSERPSQLRGEHRTWKVWCPKCRQWSKIPMLSPVVCPSCSVEWGYPDMLQRSAPQGGDREIPEPLDCEGVDVREDEPIKGKSSFREFPRDMQGM